jgi:hypothetical protein
MKQNPIFSTLENESASTLYKPTTNNTNRPTQTIMQAMTDPQFQKL